MRGAGRNQSTFVARTWALLVLVLLASQAMWAQGAAPIIDPSWAVPSQAAQRQNPLVHKPDAALGGGKIFQRSCIMCHGDATHARTNHAPDLSSPAVQLETDGSLFWRISQGNTRRAMPSFSNIPEGQRWQLVLYIRSIAKPETNAAK
jgi:mono/diheme cytochrome c family protein